MFGGSVYSTFLGAPASAIPTRGRALLPTFHRVFYFRVMSRRGALPTVRHMTVPSGPGRGTVMLPGDWTVLPAGERMAELHRRAEPQRAWRQRLPRPGSRLLRLGGEQA
jgi:hypothetical protein